MEAEGEVHGVSSAEGGREEARPQITRKRRPWTAEEDALLKADVEAYGEKKWDLVPKRTGLARTGPGCRSRWLNTIRSGLKNGVAFSHDEEILLCRLHEALGNKWSRIAAQMEGRSENEIRQYWFSYVYRCQQTGLNVYPPDQVQAAGGQSDLQQPRPKRHRSGTSPSPQQPPTPPYLLTDGYPNYPVVSTHQQQLLDAVFPVTMAEALHTSQIWSPAVPLENQLLTRQNVEQGWQPSRPPLPFGNSTEFIVEDQHSASLAPLPDQIVNQGMQPHPLALPLGNTTEFNENGWCSPASILALLNQNVEQGRQPQPPLALVNQNVEQGRQPQSPALLLGDATEFNNRNQLSASLLPQSHLNVEQEMQPQPPAVPLENATEFCEEEKLLTSQNVEQERQSQSPALPLGDVAEFNEEGQSLTSPLPLSDQNVEQKRQPQSPASPFGYSDEFDAALWCAYGRVDATWPPPMF